VAQSVRDIFMSTEGVVDVDCMVEAPKRKLVFELDREKTALHGVPATQVVRSLRQPGEFVSLRRETAKCAPVLLIDFVNLSLEEGGKTLGEAVIEAGAVRLRPIMLTAGTVVVGAFVILFGRLCSGPAPFYSLGRVRRWYHCSWLTARWAKRLYRLTELRAIEGWHFPPQPGSAANPTGPGNGGPNVGD